MTTQREAQAQTGFSAGLEEKIQNLPPSAKLVAFVLQHNGKLSKQELVEETLLSERTVRLGIEKLQQADVVKAEISMQDARKRLYELAAEPTAEASHAD